LFCAAAIAAVGCASPRVQPADGRREVDIHVTKIPNGVVARVTSAKPQRVDMIRRHWAQKEKAHRAARRNAGAVPAVVSTPWALPPSVRGIVAGAKQSVNTVDMAGLKAALDSREDLLLVDVRQSFEYAAGHIPGAFNVPRGTLEFAIWQTLGLTTSEEDLNRKICVYCLKGGRAFLAARSLRELGFKRVTAADVKLEAWQQAGYPLE
jgi:rhodanese-related sulfurtransferase